MIEIHCQLCDFSQSLKVLFLDFVIVGRFSTGKRRWRPLNYSTFPWFHPPLLLFITTPSLSSRGGCQWRRNPGRISHRWNFLSEWLYVIVVKKKFVWMDWRSQTTSDQLENHHLGVKHDPDKSLSLAVNNGRNRLLYFPPVILICRLPFSSLSLDGKHMKVCETRCALSFNPNDGGMTAVGLYIHRRHWEISFNPSGRNRERSSALFDRYDLAPSHFIWLSLSYSSSFLLQPIFFFPLDLYI